MNYKSNTAYISDEQNIQRCFSAVQLCLSAIFSKSMRKPSVADESRSENLVIGLNSANCSAEEDTMEEG